MHRSDRRAVERARASLATITTLFALAACGGGGGTSDGGSPPPPPPPAPSLTVSAATSAIVAGGTPTALHATLANATATPTWTLAGPGSLSATSGTDVQYLSPDSETPDGSATITVTAAGLTKTVTLTVATADVAGHHWSTLRAPITAQNSAAYAGGAFVTVGLHGSIGSSPDGVHWTSHDTTVDHAWVTLTHGDAGWIAVAADLSVASSPDGTTWTVTPGALPVTGPSSTWWVSVAVAGNGTYVVLGQDFGGGNANRLWTSTDGQHWTGAATTFTQIASGAGIFVAANTLGTSTSTDGVHWKAGAHTPIAQQLLFANGSFAAWVTQPSIPGNAYVTSTDGIHWSTPSTTSYFNALHTDGTSYYDASMDGGGAVIELCRQDDPNQHGIECNFNFALDGAVNGVAKGDTGIVVVSSGGDIAAGSDVYHLSQVVQPSYGTFSSVAQSGGRTIVASSTSLSGDLLVDAGDGSWTHATMCPLHAVMYDYCRTRAMAIGANGAFIAAGSIVVEDSSFFGDVGMAASSLDGTTWTRETLPAGTGILRGLVNDGHRIVGVDTTGNVVLRDATGTWTTSTAVGWPATQTAGGIAFGNGHYVIVGLGGLVATSSDLAVWTVKSLAQPASGSSTPQDFTAVAWTGHQFVAVGKGGAVATSTDGADWIVAGSATTLDLDAIAVSAGGEIVAVGQDGVAETSLDGTHWTLRASGATRTLHGIAAVADGFVAVGEDGVILQSAR